MKKLDFTSLPKKAISAFKSFPKKQQIIFGAAAGAGTFSLIIVPVASSIASRSDNHTPTYVDSVGKKADLTQKYFKVNGKYFTKKEDALKELNLVEASISKPIYTDGKTYDVDLSNFGVSKLKTNEINDLKKTGVSVKINNTQYSYFDKVDSGNLDTPGFFKAQPSDKAAVPFAIPTSLWTDGSGNYFTTGDKAFDNAKANNKIIENPTIPVFKNGQSLVIGENTFWYFDTSVGGAYIAHPGFFVTPPTTEIDMPTFITDDIKLVKDGNYFTTNDKAIEYLKNDASLTTDKKLVDFDKTKLNLKKGDNVMLDGTEYSVNEYSDTNTSVKLDHPGWRLSKDEPLTKEDNNLVPNGWYGKIRATDNWSNKPDELINSLKGSVFIHTNKNITNLHPDKGDKIIVNDVEQTYYDAIPVTTPGWYKTNTTYPSKVGDLVTSIVTLFNDGSSDQYYTTEDKLLKANGINSYTYNANAIPSSFTIDGKSYTFKKSPTFKVTQAGWYPVSGVSDANNGPAYPAFYSVKDSSNSDFISVSKSQAFIAEARRILKNNEYNSNTAFPPDAGNVPDRYQFSLQNINNWIKGGAPVSPFTSAFSGVGDYFWFYKSTNHWDKDLPLYGAYNAVVKNYQPNEVAKNQNFTYNNVEYKYYNIGDACPLIPPKTVDVFLDDQSQEVSNPLQNITLSDSSNNFFSDSTKAMQHLGKTLSSVDTSGITKAINIDGTPVQWLTYYKEKITPGFYLSVPNDLNGHPDFDGISIYWANILHSNMAVTAVWTDANQLWKSQEMTGIIKKQLSNIPKTDTIPNMTFFEYLIVKKLGLFVATNNNNKNQPDINIATFSPKYQIGNNFYSDDSAVIANVFQRPGDFSNSTDYIIDGQTMRWSERTQKGPLQNPGIYTTFPHTASSLNYYDLSDLKYATTDSKYAVSINQALSIAQYTNVSIDPQDHTSKNIDGKQYIYFDSVAGENLVKLGFFYTQPNDKTKEPDLTIDLKDLYKSSAQKEFFTTEELSMQHDKISKEVVGYYDSSKKSYLDKISIETMLLPISLKEIVIDNKKYEWK